MNYLTLEELKRQCRVDFDEDDALLESCGEAAEAEVLRLVDSSGEADPPEELPAALRQAMLIRAAQFYSQPEGGEKPNALFESLIRPYQKL